MNAIRRKQSHRLAAAGFAGVLAVVLAPALSAQQFFTNGDSLPAYIHSSGAGSRVDVRADSSHDGSGWTVVFRRSLQTGDPDHDIQFVPGGVYSFQVTTWDNAGGGAHDLADQGIVYTMTIPMTPDDLEFSALPLVLSELSGEYLASGEVEITVAWDDETRDDQRKRWSFDGSDWAQSSDNEDRVAFIWDMQNDGFATAGTCMMMCHPPLMYTAPRTRVDTWHHKATRTAPSGFSDDKWWDDGAGGTASGRHSDPGVAAYADNTAAGHPRYQSTKQYGPPTTFLMEGPAGMREAMPFSYGIWAEGDSLPAYVHRRGAGSRADVSTEASHDGSAWSVTFRRKLDTGDATGDIAFAAGGMYSFQVATFDNTGGSGHDTSNAGMVYGMTIPTEPGDLVFSAVPSSLSSLSGRLLSSDEIELTATWLDATRNEARKQWQFLSGKWMQSGDNEDRLAIIWDNQNDGFVSAGTCMTMCHVPLMYTSPGTIVDTWHFKASRTGPAGFTDDKWWDDGDLGTGSGRRSDAGMSVYMDNDEVFGHPEFMSTAGPSTSSLFLAMLPAAPGWAQTAVFGLRDGLATKGKLKVNTKLAGKDAVLLSGSFSAEDAPLLADGLRGTFEVGTFSLPFVMTAKGKSEKDTTIKIMLKTGKKGGRWSASLKNVDLRDALAIADETVPKPGSSLSIEWNLTLNNGWALKGPSTLTYVAKAGKGGKGKLVSP
jgi:hypothetical protein